VTTSISDNAPERPDLDIDLDRVWSRVATATLARQPGRVERGIAWALGSPGLARAVVTTPSLLTSWLLASAVVLGLGVLVTAGSGDPWFALLAPALAGAGVAYAYGPGIDPAYELSQTMAVSDRMVLLARVVAVCALNAISGMVATLVTAQAAGLTFGWLLPMTMVASLALAAATLTRSANIGVAAALAGWTLVVFTSAARANNWIAAVQPDLLSGLSLFYVIATVLCGLLAATATSGRVGVGKRVWQWR
jgi:hypothetical protein